MSTYVVTRKSDGVEVFRYQADAPTEWGGFEFAEHDHTLIVEPPAPSPPPPAPLRISRLAFRNRFTPTEKATIEFVAADNPNSSTQARQQAASLRASLADQRDAEYIDLNRPDTRAGVVALESLGLLARGRAVVILDTPPTATEIWNG